MARAALHAMLASCSALPASCSNSPEGAYTVLTIKLMYLLYYLHFFCLYYPASECLHSKITDGLKKQETYERNKDPSAVPEIQRSGYNFFYQLLKPRGLSKYS